MRHIALLYNLLVFCATSYAQPSIQWQRSYGGSNTEQGYSIQQTTDGGYVVTSTTSSTDGDVFGLRGSIDFWVLKLDSAGNVQWKKCLGGTNDEQPYSVRQTTDGGYVAAGYTRSFNWDVSGHHGDYDGWVVKLNSSGDTEWQRCLGGIGRDDVRDIQQTNDGGYIIAGRSGTANGDVTTNLGGTDLWVVKLNSIGEIEWQRSYGGSQDDRAMGIKSTTDGGYIVVGETFSNDGDVPSLHGSSDYWVLKLNFDGKIEWQRTLGGTSIDLVFDVVQSRDGGYAVFGQTYSNNGDVSGNHGYNDYWLVKLSPDGETEWQKAYGGSNEDWARSIWHTSDNGYVMTGQTQSSNGDAAGNDGGADMWVLKVDGAGNLQWQLSLGGAKAEMGHSIQQTSDLGYIVAGYSASNDGDVTLNKGSWDLWVVKLSPEPPSSAREPRQPLALSPNPAGETVSVRVPNGGGPLQVRLCDALGREVAACEIPNGGTLNVAHLPTGAYFATARTADGKAWAGKIWKN